MGISSNRAVSLGAINTGLATTSTATPVTLGVATATSVNKLTITQPATSATLTIPDGVTLNAGAGGTLGSNAFTSTTYAPAASPTFTGTATAANFSSSGLVADTGYSYQAPSTGFTITLGNTTWHTIIDPAGTLATGAITMPAAPVDGQIVDIRFTQIVTALTINPNSGQSVKGSPTSTAVGAQYTAIYRATGTTWYF